MGKGVQEKKKRKKEEKETCRPGNLRKKETSRKIDKNFKNDVRAVFFWHMHEKFPKSNQEGQARRRARNCPSEDDNIQETIRRGV